MSIIVVGVGVDGYFVTADEIWYDAGDARIKHLEIKIVAGGYEIEPPDEPEDVWRPGLEVPLEGAHPSLEYPG